MVVVVVGALQSMGTGHRAGMAGDQHQDCWAWWACSQEMRSERNGPLHPPIITKATHICLVSWPERVAYRLPNA